MNRNKLKTYAPQARREFIKAVTDRAGFYGLTKKKIEPVTVQGDVAVIGGKAFPKSVAAKRKLLEQRIARQGFEQVMEAMAYTWFNRFVAIRYMELHGYLDHGYRVVSNPDGSTTPEIIEHAEHVDLPGLKKEEVIELKLEGNKEAELYDKLVLAQCHALYKAMPFLFEPIDDETELLLPDNLLHSDSLIRKLVAEIPEEDWQEVEIIGWLYQFYISEKKDQVIGKVVKSEDIPAATQLFTPNWIVKYLVQNSLGRQWMATYPDSPLKGQMEYYIEPAEQTPEVQEQLKAITPTELNPEELTLLDPACGSGHILVEAYDLLKAIYQERGYRAKDIPRLILEKNLFGLEIDDRAAQLAAFALMMKARVDDRRIFEADVQPHVLAIQESKGLDAREITEALNQPILNEEQPPSGELFEEIADDKSPLFSRKAMGVKGDISQADVAHLIELFEHGKTFGSLITIPDRLSKKLPAISARIETTIHKGELLDRIQARLFRPLVVQSQLLARRFDAAVMNPPYMHTKTMPSNLKTLAKDHYAASKSDLFAMFIERGLAFLSQGGRNAMITMQNWMFLSAYNSFRAHLLDSVTFETLAHLGPRAFAEISGEVVQTTAFVTMRLQLPSFRPKCFRLTDGDSEEKRATLLSGNSSFANLSMMDFSKIPGTPIAYWITPQSLYLLSSVKPFGDVADIKAGMSTSNNDRFLRFWHEVDGDSIYFHADDSSSAKESKKTWFPFNKGGGFKKWFGNNEYVVNWRDDGAEIKEAVVNNPSDPGTTHWSRRIYNTEFFFRPCLTWSVIAGDKVAFRWSPSGHISSHKGPGVFLHDKDQMLRLLAILNSPVAEYFLGVIRQSLGIEVGHVSRIPYLDVPVVSSDVEEIVRGYKEEWDLHELSWNFERIGLLRSTSASLAESWSALTEEQECRRNGLNELEKEVYRIVVEAYEMTSCVGDSSYVSGLPEFDRRDDVEQLVSYAIGCMMGRYSLDEPGLIYAHSGNQGFDFSKYKTFPADQDGIIPITDTDWFPDDAANRFVQFIATAWPKEHLEENLKFVAESLGSKKGESSRDTIRRYLSQGFFKHHLSMYKKRPIYWLFSSGKQGAFECLVYLHRYNEGTLSRMRTEYVIPLQGRIDARIEQLKEDIASATSTAHGKRLQKERDKLIKQQAELRKFDEKLRHYADRRISLDLDDGVKVNYGKFGDLLAEVKAVTGQKAEDVM